MDLVERYFAVSDCGQAPCRPAGLTADLRRLLAARIEAREAALGRPLCAAEASAEVAGFARRLNAEATAVMRRLENACPGLAPRSPNTLEGEA